MMCIGSVYVYSSVGSVWSRQSKILAADGSSNDQFGRAVNLYLTTAMMSADCDDDKTTDAGTIRFTAIY
jgi:hypothetical protein